MLQIYNSVNSLWWSTVWCKLKAAVKYYIVLLRYIKLGYVNSWSMTILQVKSTSLIIWNSNGIWISENDISCSMLLSMYVHIASSEKSQFEFSMYQKANERVELGVLSTWSSKCDVSAGVFALAANYMPSADSSVKVSCLTLTCHLNFTTVIIICCQLFYALWAHHMLSLSVQLDVHSEVAIIVI